MRRSSTWFASRRMTFCASSSERGASRDGLPQVVASPGQRVGSGVHGDPQRTAGQLLDAAALPLVPVGHKTHCSAARTTFDSTRPSPALSLRGFSQVRGGAASGNRTPDLLITSEPLWPTELRRRCPAATTSVTAAPPPALCDPEPVSWIFGRNRILPELPELNSKAFRS